MSGTRPHLAVQGETGTAQQNHPNCSLRLLSSAYADSFTGSTSVVPACSGPLLNGTGAAGGGKSERIYPVCITGSNTRAVWNAIPTVYL